MTYTENIFIFGTSIVLLTLVLLIKNIAWEKLGLKPKSFFNGWWQVLLFNISVFTLIQLTLFYKFINLPDWMVDRDPFLPLLVIVLLQEIIFRGLLVSWLEKFGKQKALWISVVIFVILHLIAPYTWSSVGIAFAGLTFFGGYFWGWHFLKFRNIYLLTISHLLVNLSFNYVVLKFLLI